MLDILVTAVYMGTKTWGTLPFALPNFCPFKHKGGQNCEILLDVCFRVNTAHRNVKKSRFIAIFIADIQTFFFKNPLSLF